MDSEFYDFNPGGQDAVSRSWTARDQARIERRARGESTFPSLSNAAPPPTPTPIVDLIAWLLRLSIWLFFWFVILFVVSYFVTLVNVRWWPHDWPFKHNPGHVQWYERHFSRIWQVILYILLPVATLVIVPIRHCLIFLWHLLRRAWSNLAEAVEKSKGSITKHLLDILDYLNLRWTLFIHHPIFVEAWLIWQEACLRIQRYLPWIVVGVAILLYIFNRRETSDCEPVHVRSVPRQQADAYREDARLPTKIDTFHDWHHTPRPVKHKEWHATQHPVTMSTEKVSDTILSTSIVWVTLTTTTTGCDTGHKSVETTLDEMAANHDAVVSTRQPDHVSKSKEEVMGNITTTAATALSGAIMEHLASAEVIASTETITAFETPSIAGVATTTETTTAFEILYITTTVDAGHSSTSTKVDKATTTTKTTTATETTTAVKTTTAFETLYITQEVTISETTTAFETLYKTVATTILGITTAFETLYMTEVSTIPEPTTVFETMYITTTVDVPQPRISIKVAEAATSTETTTAVEPLYITESTTIQETTIAFETLYITEATTVPETTTAFKTLYITEAATVPETTTASSTLYITEATIIPETTTGFETRYVTTFVDAPQLGTSIIVSTITLSEYVRPVKDYYTPGLAHASKYRHLSEEELERFRGPLVLRDRAYTLRHSNQSEYCSVCKQKHAHDIIKGDKAMVFENERPATRRWA